LLRKAGSSEDSFGLIVAEHAALIGGGRAASWQSPAAAHRKSNSLAEQPAQRAKKADIRTGKE
jgi:hypothetical protein